jgi:hydroxyacylglutathione hydrolase
MITIIPIPAFADNYIWALRDGPHAVVVDPGDAQPVAEYLEREGLELTAILVTHHHNDQVGGVAALAARWRVPVFGPAREAIPERTQALREGDEVDVPGLPLSMRVMDVPGHTAGPIAYYGDVSGTQSLFCGDTLFAAGCGRLFEGTPEQLWSSLSALAALPDETRVYCAHEYTLANLRCALAVEPESADLWDRQARDEAKRKRGLPTVPSTIGDERRTNPFLRAGVAHVRKAAEAHAGRPLPSDVEAFAALRAWKNAF